MIMGDPVVRVDRLVEVEVRRVAAVDRLVEVEVRRVVAAVRLGAAVGRSVVAEGRTVGVAEAKTNRVGLGIYRVLVSVVTRKRMYVGIKCVR